MKPFFALAVILVVYSSRAESQVTTNNVRHYQYIVPGKTNDGWETASLNSVNLDASLINGLFERISDKSYENIHSVLLVKNGKLVVEEYFSGQDSNGFLPLTT